MSLNKKYFAGIILACLLSTYVTYSICKHQFKEAIDTSALNAAKQPVINSSGDVNVTRMDGYNYIRPLISVEKEQEDPSLLNLKNSIINKIDEYKRAGILQSAAVYLRVFKNSEWMCINDTENYFPGSIIKVAGLITYLRMEEANPGTLNKRLSFDSPKEFIPSQTYNSKQIELGKSYTVKELLKYMIAYSDNNATYLLNKNVDMEVFKKLFADLNIPLQGINNGNIKMNVKDCSMLLKVIYNSAYLSIDHSEFASELLAQCDFKAGMVKALPANIKIAHKFDEMGDATTRQLHESGIIYINHSPYLLTIMTKGNDITKLPAVLSDITILSYLDISKNPEFADNPNSGTASNTHSK